MCQRAYTMAFLVALCIHWSACPATSPAAEQAAQPAEADQARLRRPIAMVLVDEGRLLLVANRRSGSVSIVDTASNRVVSETPVGRELADMAVTPDGKRLLVVDEAAGELVILTRSGDQLSVTQRLSVSPYPVSLAVTADGSRCFVTSLWSRRLTTVELPASADRGKQTSSARVTGSLALPFAARELLLVRGDSKLLVADAFGGRLAIIDTASGSLLAVRQLPGHNIRGLATSADGRKLLVAHQILNDLAETTHNDVHWGVLMSNVLRWLVLDNVLDPQADLLAESHVHLTGDSANPGADPSGIEVTADGTTLVALAGDQEIALGKEQDYSLFRLPVGRRPTQIVASPDGLTAYVANTFSDSITVVRVQPQKIPPARVDRDIKLGPQPPLGLVDQGELLFYDASLSMDGWFSCHSCHTDGHANGLLNDNLSDKSFGAAKRVLSLLGTAHTGPWAWNGAMPELEGQIRKSIRTTMQGSDPSDEQVAALAAFVKTLTPPPAISTFEPQADPEAIERGRQIFEQQQCASCHRPPLYTTPEAYDVGLADKLGNRRFNPPSLRGVGHRERLFHDNRAHSLEDVFLKHQHQLSSTLDERQVRDLVSFLRSL